MYLPKAFYLYENAACRLVKDGKRHGKRQQITKQKGM